MCSHLLFRTEFLSQQLFIETFFDIIRIFPGVESQSESTFPFLYFIVFQRAIIETPCSTPCGDQHIHVSDHLLFPMDHPVQHN